MDKKLPVGKHKIKYDNPNLKITKEIEAEIIKDKKVKYIVYLERKKGDDLRVSIMEGGAWKQVYPELKKKKAQVKKAIKTITLDPVGPIGQAAKKPKPKPTSPEKAQKELSSGATSPVKAPVEYGYLIPGAVPWADIWVDGIKQEVAGLPLKLPVGKHKIKCNNPFLKITKEVEVEVVKDKKINATVYMKKEPGKDVKIRFIDK